MKSIYINILRNEGFKPCIFDGVIFPLKVKANIIKSGAMRGWYVTTGQELFNAGCTSLDVIWLDSDFEFSLSSIEIL
jgi:hypothetical protein